MPDQPEKPSEKAPERSHTLTQEDWAGYGSDAPATDFFDPMSNLSSVAPNGAAEKKDGDTSGTGDGSQKAKPDEGDGSPEKKEPGDGDGSQKAKPDEGDGSPEKKEPGADGQLPKGIAARLRRQRDQFARREAELQATIAKLKETGEAAAPEKASGADDKSGTAAKSAAELPFAEQMTALEIDSTLGPNPDDYGADSEAQWAEDYNLFLQEKPLKHHPKLAAKPKGADEKVGAAEAKQTQKKQDQTLTPQQEAERQWREKLTNAWQTFEAACEENDEVKDSELDSDFYEKVLDAVQSNRIRMDLEMIEHIAQSERGPEIAKLLIDSPVKSMRVFAKPPGQRTKALDDMLARVDRKAKADAGEEGNEAGDTEQRRDARGKVMPKLPSGRADSGKQKSPEDMNFTEYREWESNREKAEGASNFFV